jgi:virulence-associated protein VagC
MKSRVTEEGVLIPKDLLEGVDEVEIYKENNLIVVVPVNSHDPILDLGSHPIVDEGAPDASEKHDRYLYNN